MKRKMVSKIRYFYISDTAFYKAIPKELNSFGVNQEKGLRMSAQLNFWQLPWKEFCKM